MMIMPMMPVPAVPLSQPQVQLEAQALSSSSMRGSTPTLAKPQRALQCVSNFHYLLDFTNHFQRSPKYGTIQLLSALLTHCTSKVNLRAECDQRYIGSLYQYIFYI